MSLLQPLYFNTLKHPQVLLLLIAVALLFLAEIFSRSSLAKAALSRKSPLCEGACTWGEFSIQSCRPWVNRLLFLVLLCEKAIPIFCPPCYLDE